MKPHGATPTTHILKPQIGELPNVLDLSNSVGNSICASRSMPAGNPAALVDPIGVAIRERVGRIDAL